MDTKEYQRAWRLKNREKNIAYQREYYLANRERVLARQRKHYLNNVEKKRDYAAANREHHRAWSRTHRLKNSERFLALRKENYRLNRDKIISRNVEYERIKLQTDISFKLIKRMRSRIWIALQGRLKSARTRALLGCDISEFWAHLESKFQPGMTRENYGPIWHVDHIKPCALFDLSKPEQQRECFHYTNLQPLFASDNLHKGKKYGLLKEKT